jgi:bacterioferritin
MGSKAVDILQIDVHKLIDMLNAALSEEWLAYYQYWIGTRLMEGPMRSEIEPELLLHTTQELNHAVLVVNRIIQLGETRARKRHRGMDYGYQQNERGFQKITTL